MTHVKMKPTIRTSVKVNSRLFLAVVLGLIAWHLYPDTREGWGFGIIAILMGLSSLGCVIDAVKRMIEQKRRDDALILTWSKGPELSGTDMPNDSDLKNRGVVYED